MSVRSVISGFVLAVATVTASAIEAAAECVPAIGAVPSLQGEAQVQAARPGFWRPGGAERTALPRRSHPRRRAQPRRGDDRQPAERPARPEHGAAPARRRRAAGGEAAVWRRVLLQPRSAPADRRYAVRRRGGGGHRVPGPGRGGADADRRLRGPRPRQQSARRVGDRRTAKPPWPRPGRRPRPTSSSGRATPCSGRCSIRRSCRRWPIRPAPRRRNSRSRCAARLQLAAAGRAAGGVRPLRGHPGDGTRLGLLSLPGGDLAVGRPGRGRAGGRRPGAAARSRATAAPTR